MLLANVRPPIPGASLMVFVPLDKMPLELMMPVDCGSEVMEIDDDDDDNDDEEDDEDDEDVDVDVAVAVAVDVGRVC